MRKGAGMKEAAMNRRDFLKQTGLAGAAAALGIAGRAGGAEKAAPAALPGMPTIKLGSLEVSRLILGSNPFWGFAHKPGNLGEEMKQWYTNERITTCLNDAAEAGITALASPPDPRWCEVFAKYREGGGKLRLWIAQCHGEPEKMIEEIETAAKAGAKAIFIQGHRVEQQFEKGKFDVLQKWVERIKELGLPAGVAAHWPEIHPELQKRKFPLDFCYQCFYNVSRGETYREEERKKAVETLQQLEKPVVAYKILAAGRVPAEEGFEFAFSHLRRKDGVCVGVYTKLAQDQVRQNAALTESLSALQARS